MGIKTSIIKEIFSDALQLIPNYNDSAVQLMKFSISLEMYSIISFCPLQSILDYDNIWGLNDYIDFITLLFYFTIITCIQLSQFIFDLYCTKRNNILNLALSVI